MISNINNKYKTTMCKHFEQTGFCPVGVKCHFAHGKGELRNINDPLPGKLPMITQQQSTPKTSTNSQAYSLPPTISNYKTVKCKYFEKGFCKFNQNCGFAHGDQELRTSNSPLPQNVLNATMPVSNMMPSMYDSNVQNQIAQQQIFYLISQMEGYHVNNQEILGKLKQAQDLNQAGNVQTAASVVYTVINRPDKSKEDSDNYAIFVQNIQSLGPTLFQQMQLQYSQQASSLGLFGFNPQTLPTSPVMGGPQTLGSPYNPLSHSVGSPQMEPFGTQHYKPNGQVPSQDNNTHNMSSSIGDANAMTMLGLTNMMGNFQPMSNIPSFNPNPMTGPSNTNNTKNFGN